VMGGLCCGYFAYEGGVMGGLCCVLVCELDWSACWVRLRALRLLASACCVLHSSCWLRLACLPACLLACLLAGLLACLHWAMPDAASQRGAPPTIIQ
jgi:hypothetical protein